MHWVELFRKGGRLKGLRGWIWPVKALNLFN